MLADQDKDLDEALNYARLAKSKYPNDPGVMDTLGLVYLKKGLVDSAISELEESAAKLADNPTVRYHLALAYQLKGDSQNARRELKAALESGQQFPEQDAARRMLEGI